MKASLVLCSRLKEKRKDGDGARLDMPGDQSQRMNEAEDDDKLLQQH